MLFKSSGNLKYKTASTKEKMKFFYFVADRCVYWTARQYRKGWVT